MWRHREGIYYFESDLPITIGYATRLADQEKIVKKTTFLKQIHSAKIIDIDSETARIGDGLSTRRRNVQLGIRVADCLPIYFFNLETDVIGLLHAGWQGTLKGICERLNESFNRYEYVFGPAIGPCCYEIGADLAEKFNQKFDQVVIKRANKYFLDLKKANRQMLKGEEIGDLALCNHCEKSFASYRRDGKNTGRDIAFIACS